ncbi:MAG TPA: ABC transporter ATP-binding protein [Anaerolineaceae bacterium]
MNDVELRRVTKTFGKVVAVNDISFQVQQGEFLTLLGPSGCGKTTTMRIIAGLELPTSGFVYIREREVTYLPPYRRDVSLMFQSYALFPHKNIFDNVGFGLKYRNFPKAERATRIREALELVHLPGIEKRYPKQLSGGQQQRVALARALVVNPSVLLLDEPLSNLDLKLRERMRVELKQIQEKVGITFIFVTHDQEEALTLSDRIAVMEAGQIVQVGSPRAVYEHPQTEFVARFIGQSNILKGRVRSTGPEQFEFESEKGFRTQVSYGRQIPVGENLVIQLRAERVHVYPEGIPGQHELIFRGVIDRTVYAGDSVQYFIHLDNGETILSIQPTSSGKPLEPSNPVVIGLDQNDFVVLRGAS